MPSGDELTRWYQDEYWNLYRDEQIGMARENIYAYAWSWLGRLMPTPGVLVDVGCGAGTMLAECRAGGWQGIGFDPSLQAVVFARERGLEAYAQSFPPCPLPDETADAITFINVLDHLRDPFGALQEAWRILRQGGLLYLRVPNGPFHFALLPLLSAMRLDHFAVFHLYGFGRSAFQYHLPRLGFEILAIQTGLPSQGDAYHWAHQPTAMVGRVLKRVDQAAYLVLNGLGLIRRAWGPSIEVMARKQCIPPMDPLDRGER